MIGQEADRIETSSCTCCFDNMEVFASCLRSIRSPKRKVDFISNLPLEISQLILRKLDGESLLCAMQVSRSWMNVCQSDCYLKRTPKSCKDVNKLKANDVKQNSISVGSMGKISFFRSVSSKKRKIKLPKLLDYRDLSKRDNYYTSMDHYTWIGNEIKWKNPEFNESALCLIL